MDKITVLHMLPPPRHQHVCAYIVTAHIHTQTDMIKRITLLRTARAQGNKVRKKKFGKSNQFNVMFEEF